MPSFTFRSNSPSRESVTVDAPDEASARSIAMTEMWGPYTSAVPQGIPPAGGGAGLDLVRFPEL